MNTTPNPRTSSALGRRSFLASAGALGVGLTVGCGADAGGSDAGDKLRFDLPDATAGFPKKDLEFRLIDSNDTKVPFWEAFFEAYEKKHSNISTQYDGLPWNRISEVVPLGFRNGTAHDLIQLPGTIPLSLAVSEGWVAPFDDYVPDFERWKKSVPGTKLVEGVQVFDGKLYQITIASDKRYHIALHYNKKLMNDVGYDPQTEPLTWDTYRDAARKVTEKGKGQAYGIYLPVEAPASIQSWIVHTARIAGMPAVDQFLQPSGEYYYTADEIKEALEYLRALQKDGSLFPGSSASDKGWGRVVRGNVAMLSGGPWITVSWEQENPDFAFGVGAHPAPNDSPPTPLGYSTLGGDGFVMAASNSQKEVAGDIMGYLTSLDGQTNWGEITGVGNPPVLQKAAAASTKKQSPQAKKCLELANSMVAKPEPKIANPDVAKVDRHLEPVSPSFAEVLQAIFLGETTDAKRALQEVKDQSERALDDAIETARKREGSTATRDDYVFANWDPTKDYTIADYEQR